MLWGGVCTMHIRVRGGTCERREGIGLVRIEHTFLSNYVPLNSNMRNL